MSGGHQVVARRSARRRRDLRDCWETVPEIASFNVAPASGDYFRCALTPANGTDLRDRVFESHGVAAGGSGNSPSPGIRSTRTSLST